MIEAGEKKTCRCDNVPRTQDIHSDALTAPLHGQTAAQLNDSRFRTVVHARPQAFVRNEGAHGSDEDDRSDAAVLFHLATAAHG